MVTLYGFRIMSLNLIRYNRFVYFKSDLESLSSEFGIKRETGQSKIEVIQDDEMETNDNMPTENLEVENAEATPGKRSLPKHLAKRRRNLNVKKRLENIIQSRKLS